MSRPADVRLAKLSRPRLRNAVDRPRLFKALDDACVAPVVWVGGPPGSGKTTLVSTYIEARNAKAIWYQVDPSDADPASFFYFMSIAAARMRPRLRLPLLTQEYAADVAGFARRYFQRLFARLLSGTLIVLDNYHEAGDDSALQSIVDVMCETVPNGLRICLMSRAGPPPSWGRLRASERLVEIDWPQLRLTDQEAHRLCVARGLSDADAGAQLQDRCDGWAAGLTLLLAQNAGMQTALWDGRRSDASALFDYFTGVVFESLPVNVQRVLLRTAIMPRFDLDTACTLCKRADVELAIELLGRHQLFLYRSSRLNPVFHYHALFRAFLLQRGRNSFSQAELIGLRRRAGERLKQSGQAEDAVTLFAEVMDWDSVARIICDFAPGLLAQGRWRLLQDWIATLPATVTAASADLLYWSGKVLANVDLAKARACFEGARASYETRGVESGELACLAELIGMSVPENRDQKDWPGWLDSMRRLLASEPCWQSDAQRLHVACAYLFAGSHVTPDDGDFERHVPFIQACLDNETIDVNVRAATAVSLTLYFSNTGDHSRLRTLEAGVAKVLADPALAPANCALLMVIHAFGQYAVFTALDAAHELLLAAESMARAENLPTLIAAALQFRTEILVFYDRDREEGRAAIDAVRRLGAMAGSVGEIFVHNNAMHLATWDGHSDRALVHAEECIRLCRQSSVAFLVIFGRQCIHAFTNAGRLEDARNLIGELRIRAGNGCYANSEALLLLQESYVALVDGDDRTCRVKLAEGLALARRDVRQAQPVFWMGKPLGALLALALRAHVEVPVALDLIRRLDIPPPCGADESWPWPVAVHTLGRFEVTIRGEPLRFGRKTPRKTLALLKVLIGLGGVAVMDDRIIDALWPEEEGDAAERAFTASLSRLRRLLGDGRALVQRGGCLSVDRRRCWVDAWDFEEAISNSNHAGSDRLLDALSTYQGPFLAEDDPALPVSAFRERLRGAYIDAVCRLAAGLEADGRYGDALDLYRRGLPAEPLAEAFYQGLMRCHGALGQRADAAAAYRALRRVLAESFRVGPSVSTEQLRQTLDLTAE